MTDEGDVGWGAGVGDAGAGDPRLGACAGDPRLGACARCLARAWLIGRLSGHLDVGRGRIDALLELDDEPLLRAVGGRDRAAIERELAAFRPDEALDAADRSRLAVVCRCHPAYPVRLLDLPAPPAVLHVAGRLGPFFDACDRDLVAVVGTREPTAYGSDFAAGLGRQLGTAGVTVVSGMAHGIDAAAHSGALGPVRNPEAGSSSPSESGAALCTTIAVLPGGADRPYPRGNRALYSALVRDGAVVSELPPGLAVRRWMFPARNRIIAALSVATVVVEADERSGALITARVAAELGRPVGAVPGRVTTPQAAGPLELIVRGAAVIRGAQDVIGLVFGAGARELAGAGARELAGAGARELAGERRPALSEAQSHLLRQLEGATDTLSALARSGLGVDQGLAELASLELAGWIRRGPGGRYSLIP